MLICPLLQIFFLLNTNFKCCYKHRNGHHLSTGYLSSENWHVYTETQRYNNNLHSRTLCLPERIYTVGDWEKCCPKVKGKKNRDREKFTGKTKFPRKQKCWKENKVKCCGTVKKLHGKESLVTINDWRENDIEAGNSACNSGILKETSNLCKRHRFVHTGKYYTLFWNYFFLYPEIAISVASHM